MTTETYLSLTKAERKALVQGQCRPDGKFSVAGGHWIGRA
jgi:hypothetical protein